MDIFINDPIFTNRSNNKNLSTAHELRSADQVLTVTSAVIVSLCQFGVHWWTFSALGILLFYLSFLGGGGWGGGSGCVKKNQKKPVTCSEKSNIKVLCTLILLHACIILTISSQAEEHIMATVVISVENVKNTMDRWGCLPRNMCTLIREITRSRNVVDVLCGGSRWQLANLMGKEQELDRDEYLEESDLFGPDTQKNKYTSSGTIWEKKKLLK